MKIISLINDPNRIPKILEHLGLRKPHPAPDSRKPKVPAPGPVVMEDFDDDRRRYEEPGSGEAHGVREMCKKSG
jgi:hypothetical protein